MRAAGYLLVGPLDGVFYVMKKDQSNLDLARTDLVVFVWELSVWEVIFVFGRLSTWQVWWGNMFMIS